MSSVHTGSIEKEESLAACLEELENEAERIAESGQDSHDADEEETLGALRHHEHRIVHVAFDIEVCD